MPDQTVWNIPHGPGNARNSEGAFVTLRDGRLLFAYSRYRGDGGSDGDRADLVAITSSDGGITWSDSPRLLVSCDGYQNVMSVSLLRLQDGRIALFYLRKNGLNDCRVLVRFSGDDSASWSEPIECTPRKGYFILNNDRVIQLRDGRILLPIAQHWNVETPGVGSGAWFDGRGHFMVMLSDDGGHTWTEGPERWTLPSGRDYLQEPGSIELADGRIWTFFRTNTGRQWQSFSADRGVSWSCPVPSRFRSPRSPLSMKRIPATGDLLAVWNDTAQAQRLWGASQKLNAGGWLPGKSWGRTPLAAAVSRDEGKSWSRSRLLEQEPDHGYCYVAIHFDGESVLLAYCCGGGTSGGVLQDLRIRRVPLDWFYGRRGRPVRGEQ